MKVLGTCSICGGAVAMPFPWYGTLPPKPTCTSCHAVKKDNGSVIDMKPADRGEFEFKQWAREQEEKKHA